MRPVPVFRNGFSFFAKRNRIEPQINSIVRICIVLNIITNSIFTTENTVLVKKKYSENLQVKKLRIMFVSESNKS
jgi:hypothetical protein